jgi:hypothetical protein
MEEHVIAISDYKFSLRPILFLGLFGIVVPAGLLAYLPHDQTPFSRSYFAIAGHAIALFGILLFVKQFGPNTDLRISSKRPDVIKAWRILGTLPGICLLGVLFAQLFPFPLTSQRLRCQHRPPLLPLHHDRMPAYLTLPRDPC